MEFNVLFVDDSKQKVSQRLRNLLPGAGDHLQGYGGIVCRGALLPEIAWDLRELCRTTGFGDFDEFKWSPKAGTTMHALDADLRQAFLAAVCDLFERFEIQLLLSVSGAVADLEEDRASLHRFLTESISSAVSGDFGLSYVFDLPSNGYGKGGPQFLKYLSTTCADPVHRAPRVAFELCTDSTYSRLLQAADFATSCSLAYLVGDRRYSDLYMQRLVALIPAPSAAWPAGGFWVGEDDATKTALLTSLGEATPAP
ncbi:hypothetical protein KSP35_16235 [Aquihabitans sp. G128]|uniref:hypothetical protein n=1 Tax=Aquihabitans sp. G128 TaxID=2849779 RepID=UPI001C2395B9|nr:hypothetical protein [Aquihabitans sp. G128]QXC59913.1 hypothetical protein KSP35_16235 [Aquihabitans sp. G128]